MAKHIGGCVAFRCAGCWSEPDINHQPIAVIGKHVSKVAQPSFGSAALLEQTRLRIRYRLMGLVRALLPATVYGRILLRSGGGGFS